MDPAHEPTVRALEALMVGRRGRVGRAGGAGAGADLRERRRVGPGDRRLRGDAVAARRTPRARSSCWRRIAEIEERRLSHQNAAFDVYGRALRVDPTNQDVLAQLDRLAAETGHWAKLATLFATELDKIDDPRQQIDMLLRLGARLRGGDRPARGGHRHLPQGGRGRAARARQALVALDRLYGRAQQWDELADDRAPRDPASPPPTTSGSRSPSGWRRSTSWR